MGPIEDKAIVVHGAREHNLKDITVRIPRDQFVVITGLSGSGKSSLAFDTIYAEGRRRYVESLSAYARQFLEQMQKPDVEYIEGLPPTIAIEQRAAGANPRSTVATTTEIYDYMRLLFARIGKPHCYQCGQPIAQQTTEQIVDQVLRIPEGTRVMVLAPLVRGRKGEHKDVLARIRREGFVRLRADGVITELENVHALDKNRKHDLDAVVDRLVVKPEIAARLSDSVELALQMGDGLAIVTVDESGKWTDRIYSERFACPTCGVSLSELTPRMFSFNSPYGACPSCDGLGTTLEFDPDLIVPDQGVSLAEGAIEAWRKGGQRMAIYYSWLLREFAQDFGISRDIPFEQLPARIQRILLNGTKPADARQYGKEFEGVIPNLARRFERTTSEYVKQRLHAYLSEQPCATCGGARLRPESLAVRLDGQNIASLSKMTVEEALAFFQHLDLDTERKAIARQILKEILARLGFLVDVGLPYLTLDRTARTLSGGEAQRIRLATQVGSGLVGVCYVLDEPTIGLHQRDNDKLIHTLLRLRDLGNTVLVVEHDEATIRQADHVVDLGPGAGANGGEVVAQGRVDDVARTERSITGQYLSGRQRIELPARRRRALLKLGLDLEGACENNLKNVNVTFPLGVFICVTGVSGSGKSTLITQTLYPALARRLHQSREKPGAFTRLVGASRVDKVIQIDQSPIGRTPRSNPATYTNVFDPIRHLFAQVREARIRGYKPGRFSFNVKGGRCEACQGQGTKKIEMHFLPDVYVTCDACKGRRYNREALEIKYKNKSIADVLDMRIEEAVQFFTHFPKIKRVLQTLADVGIGYMQVGQSSTTLSGGEAQRVKLAAELGRAATGRTLYILDEPTVGLHFADIQNLLNVLNRLVDMGNTVLVIEHNLDVVKTADYLIDLGPEGGEGGGTIVATGTPEEVARHPTSYTGRFLRDILPAERLAAAGS
jgi:excinuclease ABC subunit A